MGAVGGAAHHAVEGSHAQRGAGASGQPRDGCLAGVGVVSREREHSGVILGQDAVPTDDAAQRLGSIALVVEGGTGGDENVSGIIATTAPQLGPVGGAVESNLQRAGIDRRVAGVGADVK